MKFRLAGYVASVIAAGMLGAIMVCTPSALAAQVRGRVAGGAGYTLVALSPNGSARFVHLGSDGSFRLGFPRTASGVQLDLIQPDGAYFGPVVFRHSGSCAYETLSGRSASLDDLRLDAGFAAPARRVPRGLVESAR